MGEVLNEKTRFSVKFLFSAVQDCLEPFQNAPNLFVLLNLD
jgi:hypothetical protein